MRNKGGHTPEQERIEQELRHYLQREAGSLKAPAGLWSKMQPRLETADNKRSAGRVSLSRSWLSGPRLAVGAGALAAAAFLIGAGIILLVTRNNDTGNLTARSSSADHGLGYGAIVPPAPSGAKIATSTTTATARATTTAILAQPPVTTMTTTVPGYGGDTWSSGNGPSSIQGTLDTAGRQVISTALISIEVPAVQDALNQVRSTAQDLGGYVEQLSSGSSDSSDSANVTIRVPQSQFYTALDRLQALGRVLKQNLGSQDVTDQFIDLNARLDAAQKEEQSLLSLLDKAQSIADVIALQSQLSQVRSQVESLQGQLNFLSRAVDLSTISVSLSTPAKTDGTPPSGSLTIDVHNADASMTVVKSLVTSVKGAVDAASISAQDGTVKAQLTFRVFSADFDRVVTTIQSQGKTEMKLIQEGIPPQGRAAQPSSTPDAQLIVTLIQSGGFWTATTISLVSLGGVILAALAAFFALAFRAGMLRKKAGS